jgi:hypothetical protein
MTQIQIGNSVLNITVEFDPSGNQYIARTDINVPDATGLTEDAAVDRLVRSVATTAWAQLIAVKIATKGPPVIKGQVSQSMLSRLARPARAMGMLAGMAAVSMAGAPLLSMAKSLLHVMGILR